MKATVRAFTPVEEACLRVAELVGPTFEDSDGFYFNFPSWGSAI